MRLHLFHVVFTENFVNFISSRVNLFIQEETPKATELISEKIDTVAQCSCHLENHSKDLSFLA